MAGTRRLVYLTAIRTGLRRSELKELRWDDLHIEPFELRPYIALRAETTKARRGDIIPLRKDLARELREAKAEWTEPSARVFKSLPKMATFKRDLAKADIEHIDNTGKVVDFHALRHTLSTMLAQTGISDQMTTEIMRHTDSRLTRKTYTHLRVIDTAAAVEQLPDLSSPAGTEKAVALRTGTDDAPANHSKKVLTKSTSGPVFFSRSMAQSSLLAENNDNSASEMLSREKSFHTKQIAQKKKAAGLLQRPFEKMERV